MINPWILSFPIRLVLVRYKIPKIVRNPLFLQPDRSFDFRIMFLNILFLLHIRLRTGI